MLIDIAIIAISPLMSLFRLYAMRLILPCRAAATPCYARDIADAHAMLYAAMHAALRGFGFLRCATPP